MPTNNPNLDALLQYLLLGAGTYGATRLYSNLAEQDRLENEAGKDKSTLTIDLPEKLNPIQPSMPKMGNWGDWIGDRAANAFKDFDKAVSSFVIPPVAFGGGFMGTKYLYDLYKKKQLENEIAKAKQDYMQTLANFKQSAEKIATPLTDAFCEGIKMAQQAPVPNQIDPGPASNDPLNLADQSAQLAANSGDDASWFTQLWRNPVSKRFFSYGTGTGALITAALLLRADQKRKEKEQKRILPSSVEINYVPTNQPPPNL